MDKLKLYETTLLKLAQAGNPEAKLALELGALMAEKSVDASAIMSDLRAALTCTGEALKANGYEWTCRTDTHINDAVCCIGAAMNKLV